MNSITVTARQWSGGWELEIDQDNITQVRSLANASAQVVDYLDTLDPTVDHRTWDVHIVPDLGDLTQKFEESKRATAEAAALQVKAGQLSRELVRELRSRNFSVSDVAVMLNVSRGRVSQLDRWRRPATRTHRQTRLRSSRSWSRRRRSTVRGPTRSSVNRSPARWDWAVGAATTLASWGMVHSGSKL